MSETKDLPATVEPAAPPKSADPVSPASRAAAANPDPRAALPLEESSSDANVARARRRSDVVPIETQRAALAETLRYLGSMSRTPFRKVLGELLECKPTPEAVRRFADKYPDRWAQAVSMMAGLSGFDRGVVEVNVFNVKGLSDVDLMARYAELQRQLAALAKTGDVVDAEVVSETKK